MAFVWSVVAALWNANLLWALWAAALPLLLAAALRRIRPALARGLAVAGLVVAIAVVPAVMAEAAAHGRFLAPILAAATGTAAVAGVAMAALRRPSGLTARALAAQIVFLAAFILVGEHRKRTLVTEAAAGLGASCLHAPSFVASVRDVWSHLRLTPHALVRVERATLVWSFREMRYLDVPETTARNLDHGPCSRQGEGSG